MGGGGGVGVCQTISDFRQGYGVSVSGLGHWEITKISGSWTDSSSGLPSARRYSKKDDKSAANL